MKTRSPRHAANSADTTNADVDAPSPGKETYVEALQRKLPDGVRGQMERSLGADFSEVRVHVDGQAERVGAQAFATGNDVHFAQGKLDPDSVEGRELIGHELAHVVQQRNGRTTVQGKGLAVVDDPALEAEADVMGARAARGEVTGLSAGGGAATGMPVQRKAEPPAGDAPKESKPSEPKPSDILPEIAGMASRGADAVLGGGTKLIAVLDVVKKALEGAGQINDAFTKLYQGQKLTVTGQPLPELITPEVKDLADGVMRYEKTKLIVEKALKIGLEHGIDFRKAAKSLPVAAALAPPSTAPDAAAPAPKAPATTTDLAAADPMFLRLMTALQSLSSEQFESDVRQATRAHIHEEELAPVSFWWNVDNDRGYNSEPDTEASVFADPDWGEVVIRAKVADFKGHALSGMHPDVLLFGLAERPPRPVDTIGWWIGGGIEIRERGMQALKVTAAPRPDLMAPIGGYRVDTLWEWDASTTEANGELFRVPGIGANWTPTPKGKPDFGWWR